MSRTVRNDQSLGSSNLRGKTICAVCGRRVTTNVSGIVTPHNRLVDGKPQRCPEGATA